MTSNPSASEPIAFEPDTSWATVEKKIAAESDPVCRGLLEQVRDHLRAEIGGELEPLMETLTDDTEYHFRMMSAPDGAPKTRADVRTFYEGMIASGGNRFQFDIERIFVDHGGVVTEGKMRQPIQGEAVLAMGVSEVDGEPIDANTTYLNEMHLLTVWPAGDGGRLVGEDIFWGSPPTIRRMRA